MVSPNNLTMSQSVFTPVNMSKNQDSQILRKRRGLMDNFRLSRNSEQYFDMEGRLIVKQCWMLMAGAHNENDNGFYIKSSFNVFDDPEVSKVVEVKVKMDEFIIEAYPDLVKNIHAIRMQFQSVPREGDFVVLSQNKLKRFQHFAAIEHLKAAMFSPR